MEKPGNHDGKQKGSSADERAAGSRFWEEEGSTVLKFDSLPLLSVGFS
jgi:hypothetical protein